MIMATGLDALPTRLDKGRLLREDLARVAGGIIDDGVRCSYSMVLARYLKRT
jgi:hypothetical protein